MLKVVPTRNEGEVRKHSVRNGWQHARGDKNKPAPPWPPTFPSGQVIQDAPTSKTGTSVAGVLAPWPTLSTATRRSGSGRGRLAGRCPSTVVRAVAATAKNPVRVVGGYCCRAGRRRPARAFSLAPHARWGDGCCLRPRGCFLPRLKSLSHAAVGHLAGRGADFGWPTVAIFCFLGSLWPCFAPSPKPPSGPAAVGEGPPIQPVVGRYLRLESKRPPLHRIYF